MTPRAWLAILRIGIGGLWLSYGLPKLTGTFASGMMSKAVSGFAQQTPFPWYRAFLEKLVIPHAEGFGHLVAIGETAVGAALVLGLFTNFALLMGLLMTTNYALAMGTYNGPPAVLTLVQFVMLWNYTGQVLGIDALIAKSVGVWGLWKRGLGARG